MKVFNCVSVCFLLNLLTFCHIKAITDEDELDLMKILHNKWKGVDNTNTVRCSSISPHFPMVVAPGCAMELELYKSSFLSTFKDIHESNMINNYDYYLFQLTIQYSLSTDNSLPDNCTVLFSVSFDPYFYKDIVIDPAATTADDSVRFIFPVNPSHSFVSSALFLRFSLSFNLLNSSGEAFVEGINHLSPVMVTVKSVSVRYLIQPSKVPQLSTSDKSTSERPDLPDFTNDYSIKDHFQKYCQLLGTVHSVILNQISIDQYRYSYQQYLTLRENSSQPHPYDFQLSGSALQKSTYPRILCGIYTISTRETQIKRIFNTWGQKCHQIIFFSNHTNEEYHTIPIYPYGEESYGNMFQKTIAVIKYINKHYIREVTAEKKEDREDETVALHEKTEFDWFLIGGDDLFVIVENLVSYLQTNELIEKEMYVHRKPLYLGRKLTYPTHLKQDSFPRPVDYLQFHSGGAGYLLNVYALKALAEVLGKHDIFSEDYDKEKDICLSHLTSSEEDYYVANCLKSLSVVAFDTNGTVDDPLMITANSSHHLQRFHALPPGLYYHFNDILKKSWLYDYDNSTGSDGFFGCSSESISFHYIDSLLMENIHNYLYRCSMEVKYLYYVFHNNNHNYFDVDVYPVKV
jgi:hypothetical protein